MLLIRNCNTYPALKQLLVKGTELSYQLTLIKIHSIDWEKTPPGLKNMAPTELNKTGFCVMEELKNGFVWAL